MKYKTSVKNWEGLAQNDALWSILTDSSKKGEKWNPEDFFKSGQIEVDTALKILKENQVEISKTHSAIDFGCGAGRLSRALTEHFSRVVGIDASPTMIEIARKGNEDLNSQLSFELNEKGDLSFLPSNSVSFALSFIVLQHIPHPQSLKFVSEFVRVLEKGGLAIFQIPVKDLRKLSLWQKFKTFIRIRERLALIGIGKGFQMDMHILEENQIQQAVESQNGKIEKSFFSNQTLPDYNGDLKIYPTETEACGYLSKIFVVRKS